MISYTAAPEELSWRVRVGEENHVHTGRNTNTLCAESGVLSVYSSELTSVFVCVCACVCVCVRVPTFLWCECAHVCPCVYACVRRSDV